MQKTLTSFDVAAILLELKERLEGARIQNIYQIRGKTLILKLHQPNQPALNLLIESGKRMHLTSYIVEKPEKPPTFCMVLRKHLRNGIVEEVSQHEFERIVIIKVKTKEGELKLIVELFGDGNIILVDTQDVVQQALTFKRMRDRNILRGEVFRQAPSSGKNPLRIVPEDTLELKEFKGTDVVRALTKLLSIGGTYAEEVLLRAQVGKNKKCESLENDDLDKIHTALDQVLVPLRTASLEPCIVMDEEGRWVDAVPFRLRRYTGFDCKSFESFNEALDEFYTKTLAEKEAAVVTGEVEQEMARQQRILDEQQASLEEETKETALFRRIGDKIYAHFHQLQTLLQRIMEEKKSGRSWQEIVSEVESEKKSGKEPAVFFESLDTKKLVLNVSVEGLPFSLLLRDSVQANAASYYDQAKKAERKAEGAEKAIEETLRRMEELKQQRRIAVEATSEPFKKRRKKAWYEKFRWFHTSEGLLVVGGKDAVTNEILVKKHMKPHDLVFHADIAGAPFVLIKTEGNTPPQQSISEAAQLAASHSRAWKAKFSAIDVYWVHPEQVSKTPPSGEYLQRGAFMIRGEKNYVRKTQLRLAIGVDTKITPPTVLGGPIDAIATRTDLYVEIIPGDLSSSSLAHKIRKTLAQKASKILQERVSKISIEEIQAFIPFGKGAINE